MAAALQERAGALVELCRGSLARFAELAEGKADDIGRLDDAWNDLDAFKALDAEWGTGKVWAVARTCIGVTASLMRLQLAEQTLLDVSAPSPRNKQTS